jgi:hypothetical protein
MAIAGTGRSRQMRIYADRRPRGALSRWTSADGGASSVELGPQVTFPAAPSTRSDAACQLVTPAEATAALGAPTSASTDTSAYCVYTAQTGGTLTADVQLGLTAAEVQTAEQDLANNNDYIDLNDNAFPSDQIHRFLNEAATKTNQAVLVEFLRGIKPTLSLSPRRDSSDAKLIHIGLVALDTLYGVPVKREN